MTDNDPTPEDPYRTDGLQTEQPAYEGTQAQPRPAAYQQPAYGQQPPNPMPPQYAAPYQQPEYGTPYPYQPQPNPSDTGSFGWAVLGFFVPVAGLILWLVWKDTQPRNALKAGKGALVAAIVWAVFVVLYIILIIGLLAWSASSSTSALGVL